MTTQAKIVRPPRGMLVCSMTVDAASGLPTPPLTASSEDASINRRRYAARAYGKVDDDDLDDDDLDGDDDPKRRRKGGGGTGNGTGGARSLIAMSSLSVAFSVTMAPPGAGASTAASPPPPPSFALRWSPWRWSSSPKSRAHSSDTARKSRTRRRVQPMGSLWRPPACGATKSPVGSSKRAKSSGSEKANWPSPPPPPPLLLLPPLEPIPVPLLPPLPLLLLLLPPLPLLLLPPLPLLPLRARIGERLLEEVLLGWGGPVCLVKPLKIRLGVFFASSSS